MLKDIKNILYNEIKDEIDKYKSLKDKIEKLQERIDNLKETERSILYPTTLNEKQYTFFQKHITKRKEYLQYKKDTEEYKRIQLEQEKKQEENKSLLEKLENEKESLESECSKIETVTREKYGRIKKAKTLKQLDITFEEATKILKDNGIQVVLDESDREITENESDFDKPEDFILVHKTHYTPTNNEVKSNNASSVTTRYTMKFEDEEFSYDYLQARSTVHFCQNGEVSSHEYGNFDGRKYAILVPFKDPKRDNLQGFNPEDTFYKDKVNISGGYILCPSSEIEQIQSQNPNTIVIGYNGENVDGFANSFLSMLGYRHEEIGKHSWISKEAMKKHNKFMEENHDLRYYCHEGSHQYYIDYLLDIYNRIIGFAKSIIEYKNKGKKYDIDKLTEALFTDQLDCSVESGIKKVNMSYKIGPKFTNISNSSFDIHDKKNEKLFLKDIIGDKEYEDKEYDVRDSNEKFLFYQLEKQFGINIPEDIMEALQYCGTGWYRDRKKELEIFKSKIKNEQTKLLINKMIENGKIERLEDAKNVLFIRTIIQQAYERTVDKEEKKPEDDEVEI